MPDARLNIHTWISEYATPYDVLLHGVEEVILHRRTAYQEMHIIRSGPWGKALVLEGHWQSCTADEFIYHEALVHPACICHGSPQKVLVLGGGEGATVREVLRWRTVERVVMVDIDREVVEACREYLPEMHAGALDDPRTELVIADAFDYLHEGRGGWDVIISDLTDPDEGGASSRLFTEEYFARCRAALKPDGRFALQAGAAAPPEMGPFVRVTRAVKAVFPHVLPYISHVPSFGSPWGFLVAGASPPDASLGVLPPSQDVAAAVDRLLAERTTDELRMLDGRAWLGLLNPPKYLRDAISIRHG